MAVTGYSIISDRFEKKFAKLSSKKQQRYLFLEPHPDIPNYWVVNSLDVAYTEMFEKVLGRHGNLSPFSFLEFKNIASEEGYEIVFLEDPTPIFAWLDSLSDPSLASLDSNLEGTTNGLLPFQVQGFNFLRTVSGGVAHWSTGTGKTVLAAALVKYHLGHSDLDLVLWVVKAHNKINAQRSLRALAHIDGWVIEGTASKRKVDYESISNVLGNKDSTPPTVILNYEKFRDDQKEIEALVTGRRVFIVWDEMPTKLKNRQTKLYKGVCKTLFTTRAVGGYYPSAKIRPSELRQVMLSATPIENNPQDWFNCVRIIDHTVYGSVTQFNSLYVASRDIWNNPDVWKNLDLMGAKASHITHQVDKEDPDIAVQFPKVIDTPLILPLSKNQQKLYDMVMSEYLKTKKTGFGEVIDMDRDDLLAMIGVFQMICNTPRAILKSAEIADFSQDKLTQRIAKKFSKLLMSDMEGKNLANPKLLALKDILDGNDGKVIIFSMYNQMGLPFIGEWLEEWGYDYVTYSSSLSAKEKQIAQDRFRGEDSCRVFLSSDSGSDSIDLECANCVVHYDLPWKWSTLTQRQNRAHRITSSWPHVSYYTLLTANTIEDRKQEILNRKYEYHKSVLKGEISEQSNFLRNRSDLLYILTGQTEAV